MSYVLKLANKTKEQSESIKAHLLLYGLQLDAEAWQGSDVLYAVSNQESLTKDHLKELERKVAALSDYASLEVVERFRIPTHAATYLEILPQKPQKSSKE